MKKISIVIIVSTLLLLLNGAGIKPAENVCAADDSEPSDGINQDSKSIQQPQQKYRVTKDNDYLDTLQIDKIKSNLPEEYEKEIVFKAEWGEEEGEYLPDEMGGGPGNVYVADNGDIYIWDLGNLNIKRYSSEGELKREYAIKDWGGYRSRMFIKGDTLFSGYGIMDLNTGEITGIEYEKTPEMYRERGKSLYFQPDRSDYDWDILGQRGMGVGGYVALIEKKRNRAVYKKYQSQYEEDIHHERGTTFIGKDKEGNYYFNIYELIHPPHNMFEFLFYKDAVYKVSADLELLSIIDIPEAAGVLFCPEYWLNYYVDPDTEDVYFIAGYAHYEPDPTNMMTGAELVLDSGVVLYKYYLK